MSDIGSLFLEESRTLLVDEYLPRVERAVRTVGDDGLWWRPNEASNSIANLLLHLAGNLRQYVIAGVGDAADTRERQAEFDAGGGHHAEDLLRRLRETVEDAARVLAGLSPERLTDEVTIQERTRTVLSAVYHAVEHFGMHSGQVILLAKARTGEDMRFYRMQGGVPRRNW